MKITKIEIEAFGPLKKYQMDPLALNTILKNNGYGKSSICNFICAMLYGISKPELRKKAIPYGMDNAGGSLELLANGHIYKIIAQFSKRKSNDTLLFYEDDSLIKEVPGEYIFGLNLASFLKTIFINPYDLELETSSAINGRLGHYSLDEDDALAFDNALKYLEDLKKKYKPLRKSDVNGSIALSKNKIDSLNDQIINLKAKEKALAEKRAEYNKLEEESSRLSNEYKLNAEAEKINSYFDHYDEKKAELLRVQASLLEIKAKYHNNMPSPSTLDELSSLLRANTKMEAALASARLSQTDEEALSLLSTKLNEPELAKEIGLERELVMQRKALLNERDELNSEELRLIKKYEAINPSSILSSLERLNLEYKAGNEANQAINRKKPLLEIILLVLSFLFVITGIGLGMLNKLFFSLAIIGLALAFVSGFIYLNNKLNYNNKMKINSDESKRLRELSLKIDELISPFGFSLAINTNKDVAITLFKEEIKKYESACINKNNIEEKAKKREAELAIIDDKLNNFLKKYGYENQDYSLALDLLFRDLCKYNELKKHKRLSDEKVLRLQADIKENQDKIDNIKLSYEIEANNLDNYLNLARLDYSEALRLNREAIRLDKELNDYYQDHNLKSKERREAKSSEGLYNNYKEILSKINIIANAISELENDLEFLDDKENELLNEEERYKNLKHKYDIITKTISSLEEASLSIKNKYIKPVKDSFSYYAQLLNNSLGLNVIIDQDYNLAFKDGMLVKDYSELSSGEKTVILLCYRLAIMDNIFKERPFIILDDSFQALDSNNFDLVKRLILKLSDKQQIFYFTCHESRAI